MPPHQETVSRQPRTGNLILPRMEDPKDSAPERSRKKRKLKPLKRAGIGSYLTLIILVLAVFAPIFSSDVLWSDYDFAQRSPYESMEHWTEAWHPDSIRSSDPITLTSYFLEQAIPLPTPIVHRAINLLLHLIASILLLRCLEALKAPAAFSATLVFALHPTVVQPIFWTGYRTEILGLILILGALYCGIRNRGTRGYLATVVLSTLACLIHPAAIAIPLILSLVIIYQEKSPHLHSFNRVLPLVCIALFIGVWTLAGQSPENSESTTDAMVSLNHAGQNMFFYIGQALLPVTPSLFHPIDGGNSYQVGADMSLLSFFLFFPFYVLAVWNFRKKWSRVMLLGLTAYLALSLYGVTTTGAFIDGSPAHENYGQYVALPAIIGLVVCAAGHLFRSMGGGGKLIWPLGFSVFLLIQIAITGTYTYAIGEPARMWQSMVEQWPESWVPKAALIKRVVADNSDLLNQTEQISTLESILEAKPDLAPERILLARKYVQAGQNTNALREYKRILRETTPDNAFLEEAAQFFDKVGLKWEASNARKRMSTE